MTPQSGSISSNLQFTSVPIINDVTCPSIDPNLWDPTFMICAGNGKKLLHFAEIFSGNTTGLLLN